ncbi:MAG: PQQ-dependent sugar dehydrogenase [Myxococcota bacterium]
MRFFVLPSMFVAFGLAACGDKSDGSSASGGAAGNNSSNGGTSAGGSSQAGSSAGGSTSGGASPGGATSGGASSGGTSSGGTPSGSGGAAPAADPCRGTKASGVVADGLCAVEIGTVNDARQLTFSSNGDLWVVSANGAIRRLRDANENGLFEASEIVQWATTGGNGQNVHIDEAGGFLYSGTTNGVRRWAWTASSNMGGTGQDVMTGQPGGGGHGKHTVHVWDGYMYVMSGSSGNVSNESSDKTVYDTARSVIKRFKLSDFTPGTPFTWQSGEVFARGLRNTLGFTRDAMGRMYGVQNGQDDVRYAGQDVHNDNPGEVIVRLEMGSSHGYPFCMVAQQITGIAPGTQVKSEIYANNTHDDAWCASNALAPATFVQAHSAPMEIIFVGDEASALPARWRNGALVSQHGSWNRNPGSGKKVVWVPFNADGTSPMPTVTGNSISFPYEVVYGESADKVASGAGQTSNGGFRPVGLAISPIDGALYISSDGDGKIYRVGLAQ